MISTFEPGVVWIIAIGEHDGSGFYRKLAEELEISHTAGGASKSLRAVVARVGRQSAFCN